MISKIFVFVFFFVLVNTQTVDINAIIVAYPPTVQTVLMRAKQLDNVLKMYQAAVQAEVQNAGLNAANIATTVGNLITNAQSQVTQLTADLTKFQTDATAAFQDLTSKLAETLGSHDGLASLIQQFGDARAALRLECEDLKNLTHVAVAAVKDLAVAKVNALIAEQQAYIQASGNLFQLLADPSAKQALIDKIVDLRAKAKLAEQLIPVVQKFITDNQGAVAKCLTAVQTQTVALTLGVKNTFDQVKASVTADVQQFKDRMTVIVGQAVADKKAFIQNINSLVDDAKQQIKVEVALALSDLSEASKEIARKTIKAALEAITLGVVVDVNIVVSNKRQNTVTFSATLSGVSAFLQQNGYTDLQSVFNAIQNDPALQQKIAEYQQALTAEQIAAAKAAIEAKIAEAQTALQAAKSNWETKVALAQTKAAEAKAALTNAALDVKEKVAKIWAARQAQIEAKQLELNITIENLKARIPQIQAELQNIQSSLQPILNSLKTAAGDLLKTLTAQKEALIDSLTQKAAELIAAQKATIDSVATNFAVLLTKLKSEKEEIAADIQTFVQNLKATATEIHNHVRDHQEEIKARVKELARAIEANIDDITTSNLQLVPEGTKLTLTVKYDDGKISVDAVLNVLKGVIQAEFASDKVVVSIKSGKRNAQQVTVEGTVASTDGSTASTSENSAMFPTAAIAGIIIGVIIVIIVVVVIVVTAAAKKRDDDYESMRV